MVKSSLRISPISQHRDSVFPPGTAWGTLQKVLHLVQHFFSRVRPGERAGTCSGCRQGVIGTGKIRLNSHSVFVKVHRHVFD